MDLLKGGNTMMMNLELSMQSILKVFGVLLLLTLMPITSGFSLAQTDSHYFSETRHTVQGSFWKHWQQQGGLVQLGYPITDELQEISDLNGQTYIVQYFERAEFELHPENPMPYDVLL